MESVGTDALPWTKIKGRGLQMIYDLKLPKMDEENILAGNAKTLLKLV